MSGLYGALWQEARARYLSENPLCVMCEQADPPRRCAGYLPRPDDPDRRPGRERRPDLIHNAA